MLWYNILNLKELLNSLCYKKMTAKFALFITDLKQWLLNIYIDNNLDNIIFQNS